MTPSEAKKRVLERFPNAHCRTYKRTYRGAKNQRVILRDHSPFYVPISGEKKTEALAWLSAANNLKGK